MSNRKNIGKEEVYEAEVLEESTETTMVATAQAKKSGFWKQHWKKAAFIGGGFVAGFLIRALTASQGTEITYAQPAEVTIETEFVDE